MEGEITKLQALRLVQERRIESTESELIAAQKTIKYLEMKLAEAQKIIESFGDIVEDDRMHLFFGCCYTCGVYVKDEDLADSDQNQCSDCGAQT
jgi:hypothetical protein